MMGEPRPRKLSIGPLEDIRAERHSVRPLETNVKTHGREDLRSYLICPIPDSLPDVHQMTSRAIALAKSTA